MHEKLYLLERYFEYNENSGLGLFVFTIFIFKFRLCLAGESYLGFFTDAFNYELCFVGEFHFFHSVFFLVSNIVSSFRVLMVNSIGLPSVIFLVNNIVSTFYVLLVNSLFYILRATNCWKMSRMFGSRSWVKRRVSRVVLYFSTCSWCWNYPNKKSIKQEIITRLVKISFKDYTRFWSNLRGDPNSRLAWYSNFPKLSNHPMVHYAASTLKSKQQKKWIQRGLEYPTSSVFRWFIVFRLRSQPFENQTIC